MKEEDGLSVYKSDSFVMEVEKIFQFLKMENTDNFSEEDYQFFLYLVDHWKRLLGFFPSIPEDMQALISEELTDMKK